MLHGFRTVADPGPRSSRDHNGTMLNTLTPSLIRPSLVNMNAGDKRSDGGLGQSLCVLLLLLQSSWLPAESCLTHPGK